MKTAAYLLCMTYLMTLSDVLIMVYKCSGLHSNEFESMRMEMVVVLFDG